MAIPAFADLNKRQQYALLVALPLLGVVAFGYLANGALTKLGPDPEVPSLVRKVEGGVHADIQAKRDQIILHEAVIARHDQVAKTLALLTDEIQQNEERLPKEAEKTEMRLMIEKLAKECDIGQVVFKSVRILEGAKGQADYQTITYQTEIEANLNGLIRYIDLIEKNQRFMTVKSMTLRPGRLGWDDAKRALSKGLHSANMEIVTYVYTKPSKVPR